VLLRDALFFLVDKPAGLLSVPGRGAAPDAASLLARWHAASASASPSSLFRSARAAGLLALGADGGAPRVVHRLDEATSGLLLLPRSAAALSAVAVLFAQRRVRKRYEAVLDCRAGGAALDAGAGEVDTPLGPNSHVPIVQTWREGGGGVGVVGGGGNGIPGPLGPLVGGRRGLKPALTRWRVLERGAGAARVLLEPVTGRTHQLRLHCALPPPLGLGCPVFGDRFYGDPRLCVESYQPRIAGVARDEGAGSVAALLRALEARRVALACAGTMPRLDSCALLRDAGAGAGAGPEARPVPRLLLHARELLLPDDFGGHWREGFGLAAAGEDADAEAAEAAEGGDAMDEEGGAEEEQLLLAADAPVASLRGEAASAGEDNNGDNEGRVFAVNEAVLPWPRFGWKNTATRRPAPRRVLRFSLPAPF